MASENKTLSQNLQYQEKTEKQHILENPDTYTGSSDNVSGQMFIFKENCIKLEEIEYNPALYKLFDEAVVNCLDHVTRTLNRVVNVRLAFKFSENVKNCNELGNRRNISYFKID